MKQTEQKKYKKFILNLGSNDLWVFWLQPVVSIPVHLCS